MRPMKECVGSPPVAESRRSRRLWQNAQFAGGGRGRGRRSEKVAEMPLRVDKSVLRGGVEMRAQVWVISGRVVNVCEVSLA